MEAVNPISLTRRLLACNTINPPGIERNCAKFLSGLLEDRGFKVRLTEFAENRTSVIACLADDLEKLLLGFSGHMDTVPLGSAKWRKDPFGGDLDGDKLYGRGAADMKGGLAAMVTAAVRMADVYGPKARLILIITAGEETGCQGAYHLATTVSNIVSIGAMVIGEPTSNYPFIGHKGVLWLQAQASGIAAHGSRPEKGANAIYKAAEAILRLRRFDFRAPPHPLLGVPTLNVGTISGGVNINSVPDSATFGIDIRTTPDLDSEALIADLRSVLGNDIRLKRLLEVASVVTDVENPWIQNIFEVMTPLLNERPKPKGAAYFTDASALVPELGHPPTVILGPGEPEMAHKTDEFCYLSKIKQAQEAYFEIAKRWCESQHSEFMG